MIPLLILRRTITWTAAVTAIAAISTGCTLANDKSSAMQANIRAGKLANERLTAHLPHVAAVKASPQPSLGQPQPESSPNIQVTINTLHRDSSGLVTLTWTIKNNGQEGFLNAASQFTSDYNYEGGTAAGITLTDESAKVRYNPLRAIPSNMCTCTVLAGLPTPLTQGESVVLFEIYKLPNSVSSATINIAGYSPLKNIQIS